MGDIETPMLPLMEEIWQQTVGWQPNVEQQRQFQQLYELILQGNNRLNLTRITEATEFWEKHLWDSLRSLPPILQTNGEDKKVIDIGTGAGFPGIPFAIALPNYTVTLLDSTRKKIAFLETLLSQLGIQNATTLIGRAEEIGRQSHKRETYDIALIRAVGTASVCAEYALPLVKVGGLAILYRGQWTDEENAAVQPAFKQLGCAIESVEAFTTPLSQSVRHCLYLRKIAPTPAQFPRAVGVPAQKPL